jgi:CRP/FNR family cyclic AMP-dependent transcriptional regulator
MPVEKKSYKSEQFIFREGDPSGALYIVQKGGIVIRTLRGSQVIELGRIQAGEVIGELSFFDRLPRSASAVALMDVEVLEIPFEDLEKVYQAMPGYMKTLVASLADRLRSANDTIRELRQVQQS